MSNEFLLFAHSLHIGSIIRGTFELLQRLIRVGVDISSLNIHIELHPSVVELSFRPRRLRGVGFGRPCCKEVESGREREPSVNEFAENKSYEGRG